MTVSLYIPRDKMEGHIQKYTHTKYIVKQTPEAWHISIQKTSRLCLSEILIYVCILNKRNL